MTETEKANIPELIAFVKEKARCRHSTMAANRAFRELESRIDKDLTSSVRLEMWHMRIGESDAAFNQACDLLLKLYI